MLRLLCFACFASLALLRLLCFACFASLALLRLLCFACFACFALLALLALLCFACFALLAVLAVLALLACLLACLLDRLLYLFKRLLVRLISCLLCAVPLLRFHRRGRQQVSLRAPPSNPPTPLGRFIPCFHSIACHEDASNLLRRRGSCPVCREPIENVEKGEFAQVCGCRWWCWWSCSW